MKKVITLLSLLGSVFTLATCGSIPMDTAMAAYEGRARTIVFSGFGITSVRGYLPLELAEGSRTTGRVFMLLPIQANCNREACVEWWIFKRGALVGQGGSPRGTHTISVPLSDFTTSEFLNPNDDTEYSVVLRVYYIDASGQERQRAMRGFVRIVLINPAYTHLECNSPMVAWIRTVSPTCQVHYSTAGRVALCGECS